RFEPSTGALSWPRIAAANVTKIEREGDLQSLRQFLPDVAVGRVDAEDVDTHPGLLKAFRLAQLQAQYLLHCQQVLERQRDELQESVSNMELEVAGCRQTTRAIKSQASLLKTESRKQNKVISGYAAMLRRHNPGLAAKVRLDEQGRLTISSQERVHQNQWGTRRRRTRR
ncbi:unnamed protein product, partial [Sphacelaria rigidula]